MPLRVVILSKAHLVRQPIAQSVASLECQVQEFSDASEVVSRLNTLSPDLIVLDADGMSKEWRMLATGLGMSKAGVSLILLTSRFGFDDAHDALALKVQAVIVKPFRKDEHTMRLLDVALKRKGGRARRSAPRFTALGESQAGTRFFSSEHSDPLAVTSLAEGGLRVSSRVRGAMDAMRVGAFLPSAVLTLGGGQVGLAAEVVRRVDDSAGLRIYRILEGGPKLTHELEERFVRALGSQGKKRKW
jgi:CheY-like chemotaxis protein